MNVFRRIVTVQRVHLIECVVMHGDKGSTLHVGDFRRRWKDSIGSNIIYVPFISELMVECLVLGEEVGCHAFITSGDN
jgi:hypothetical protein